MHLLLNEESLLAAAQLFAALLGMASLFGYFVFARR